MGISPECCEVLAKLKAGGAHVVVMEHTTESVIYTEADVRFPACLVVGNEVSGVDSEVLDLASSVVEIPMLGEKNSLNIAVAAGVIGYHLLSKLNQPSPAPS